MLYFIAELDPKNRSYTIDDITEDWYRRISDTEPIDVVPVRVLIFDEKGHKYIIASPKIHPPKDLPAGRRFGGVDVGEWDYSSNEPRLEDTKEENPEELRQLLAQYLTRLSCSSKGLLTKRPAYPELKSNENYAGYRLDKLITLAREVMPKLQ